MCSRSLRNGCAKPSFSHYTKSENALKRFHDFRADPNSASRRPLERTARPCWHGGGKCAP
jgi:hypothetical protein